MAKQKILVFQQSDSAASKIAGVKKYGADDLEVEVVDISDNLPSFLDDGNEYLPDDIDADIVLDYLKHPDLSYDLAAMCAQKDIPMVASGKKIRAGGTYTPPTCCGLSRRERLGEYAKIFGAPEFTAETEDGRIVRIDVLRGAPCGATWEAARKVVGMPVGDALIRIGLETQFFCSANPAGWDPLYGKSPVHFAGEVHKAALSRAVLRKKK